MSQAQKIMSENLSYSTRKSMNHDEIIQISFFTIRTNRPVVFQIERHPNIHSELAHQW